jgi:hypothetical protein
MPTTYGFSWIDIGPTTNDWRYIQFGWDNIFASYTAGVLGYKDAAYSNLIGIIKAKSFDGFVPNHADGGSIASHSEPANGGKVLLELFERFHDSWIVEVLIDDLIDWNDWQWRQRRVVGPAGSRCASPGFITIGGDNCSTDLATATNCPGGGESGLDQSPCVCDLRGRGFTVRSDCRSLTRCSGDCCACRLWDCPDAKPDGSGGNCSVYTYRDPESSPDVMQLADMQSTSLFVLDAESIATLADAINRSDDGATARLRHRAAQMRSQLSKAWNADANSFADIYVQTGTFSDRLTPTAFYPLFAGAATDQQAVAMVEHHLLNASEFCISVRRQYFYVRSVASVG